MTLKGKFEIVLEDELRPLMCPGCGINSFCAYLGDDCTVYLQCDICDAVWEPDDLIENDEYD